MTPPASKEREELGTDSLDGIFDMCWQYSLAEVNATIVEIWNAVSAFSCKNENAPVSSLRYFKVPASVTLLNDLRHHQHLRKAECT